ncbi:MULTISPECIES: hypothetical protein [unclassified Pseudomonas]|jgi:hypothetical protein|uniref:hypothetical protein n=1 Tax=unclassified Pseudomonas TaxID=196821 RepID=UPI001CBBA735|nr:MULTISPECIES: hypothetical protein [unclassified Pseudomonas]
MRDVKAANMAVRLIEETSRNLIQWKIGDVPSTLTTGTGNYFSLFVETFFKDTRIALYEVKYRHFTDEDSFYWCETVVMAILDQFDRVIWESESDEPEIRELYRLIRRSVGGVDRLLNYFR